MCSGRGKCDCGRCKCDPGEFSGKYCEECPTCPGHRCEELRPCVECFMDGFANCSSLNCSGYGFGFVEEVREDVNGEKKLCTFPDEERCTVVYQYYSEGEVLTAEIQKEKVCPEGPDVLGKQTKYIKILFYIQTIFRMDFGCYWKYHSRRFSHVVSVENSDHYSRSERVRKV